MRKLTIKETQEILLSVMIDFDAFCRKEGLNYYMIGGTMLGAYRHHGFIPWDDDIDVGMTRDEYEKFIKKSTSFDSKYCIKNYRVSNDCDYVITRIYIPNVFIDNPFSKYSKVDKRLYFDIFPLDYAPSETGLQELQRGTIKKLKYKMSLMDLKSYDRNFAKTAAKFAVAKFMSINRRNILTSLDSEMRKYGNSDFLCSMASQYSYERQLFSTDVYGTPKEYDFEGHKFFGPQKAEEYLSQLYGKDYMQLPPVDKRHPELTIYVSD